MACARWKLEPFTEVICPAITDPGGIMPVAMLNCIPIVAVTCAPAPQHRGRADRRLPFRAHQRHHRGVTLPGEPAVWTRSWSSPGGSAYRSLRTALRRTVRAIWWGRPAFGASFGRCRRSSRPCPGSTMQPGGPGGVVFTRNEGDLLGGAAVKLGSRQTLRPGRRAERAT